MAIIAPGICRFVVNASFNGEPIANILDMQVDTTGTVTSRSDAVDAVAGDILNNWDDHIRTLLVDDYVCQSVSYVDLDEADGPTGTRTSTSTTTWPAAGPELTPPLPSSVAALVKKQIVGTRGRRSGRMYICGLSEGYTDAATPNNLLGTTVTAFNNQLDDFLNGINDAASSTVDVQRQLVTLHTRIPSLGADPVYNGYTPVEALICQSLLATQRRRLR